MSQLIVTSRYLKSGTQKSKNKRRNYTKYIATRETVEVRDQNTIDRNSTATKNQKQLLNDLLLDFPETKRYLEYEDFKANPTVENASELISTIIERNAFCFILFKMHINPVGKLISFYHHPDMRFILSKLNHILISASFMRFCSSAKIKCLQDIGLSLSVIAVKYIRPLCQIEFQRIIISEIF